MYKYNILKNNNKILVMLLVKRTPSPILYGIAVLVVLLYITDYFKRAVILACKMAHILELLKFPRVPCGQASDTSSIGFSPDMLCLATQCLYSFPCRCFNNLDYFHFDARIVCGLFSNP